MATPLEVDGPAGLNALWRSDLFMSLTGADKQNLADLLGVSRRTVERWVTVAGQRRNPFPLRLADVAMADWPDRYTLRCQATLALAFGWEAGVESDSPEESFVEPFSLLSAAILEVSALLNGELDPWLETVWRTVTLARGPRFWQWAITYERASFNPSGPQQGGPGYRLTPGEFEPDPESARWLYPDSLPYLLGFGPGTGGGAVRMESWRFPRFGVHVWRTRP